MARRESPSSLDNHFMSHTHTHEAQPAGASGSQSASTRSTRRRWPWVISGVAVVVLLTVALLWAESRHGELTSLRQDKAWGLSVEIEYAPLRPTTVTGGYLQTDAGGDDGGLYDPSADDDVPPEQVSAQIGHPVSLSFGFVPTCDGGPIDDDGTLTIQTSSGDRTSSIALPELAAEVAQWCGGGVALHLSSAKADSRGGNVEAVYRVVSPREVVITVASPGWRAEALTVTAGEAAYITVGSAAGCSDNLSRLALTATYPDGTEQRVHASAPGSEVCES